MIELFGTCKQFDQRNCTLATIFLTVALGNCGEENVCAVPDDQYTLKHASTSASVGGLV